MKSSTVLLKLFVLFLLLTLIITCGTKPPNNNAPNGTPVLDRPVLEMDTGFISNFHIEVFCSDVKLRTGNALLTWNSEEKYFDKQRLDLTIYKNGFEINIFTTLWPLKENQEFQTTKMVELPNRVDNQSLFLNTIAVDINKQEKSVLVELEGLTPGLTYFWRILTLTKKGWVPGIIIRSEAPVCPSDSDNYDKVR